MTIQQVNGDNQVIFDAIYPVGSIYMSVNSTDPGTLFGGTWERIQDAFLLAAGTNHAAGTTGGEETHKLTAAESGVPAHAHGMAHRHTHAHTHGMGHRHIHAHTHSYNNVSAVSGGGHTHTYGIQWAGYFSTLVCIYNAGMGGSGDQLFQLYNNGSWGGTEGGGSGISLSLRNSAIAASKGSNVNSTLRRLTAATGSTTHSHTITNTSYTSGAASTNYTGNSINTGNDNGRTSTDGASTNYSGGSINTGNDNARNSTDNNTAAAAANAHNNMPPYLSVYVWKRTA